MAKSGAAWGAGQVRRTLFEDRSEGRVLRAWVTGDGATAGLDCQILAGGWPEATAAKLTALFEHHRVVHGLDSAALESVAAAARDGRGSTGRVVARGTPPEPGRDGALEFIVRPSNEGARYEKDADSGRIDYRETNLIENVLAGEPVAIEIPPRPGTDGQDVFGRPATAPEGNRAEFRTGEGTRFDDQSRQVLAEHDGRVLWEQGIVSVSRTFHVRGSVDYSVGNIAFVGEVIIDGDVLDGFNVRAGGNLTVGGNVGACQLDSEGDLVVKGGVFGKGKARLRAKGRLSSRFLNDCRAESAGVLSVEREAVGSTIFTNRCLLMPEGRLVGGALSALRGVDVGVLGSALGVLTSVSAGTDYNLSRRQAEMETRITDVDTSVTKISGFLGPLLGDRRKMSQLIGKRRADLQRLMEALRGLRAERAELAGQLEEMAEAAHRGAVRQVNVRKQMNPGVLIELGAVRHRVKQTATGPLSIVEDRARGSLRTKEFQELPGMEKGEDIGDELI